MLLYHVSEGYERNPQAEGATRRRMSHMVHAKESVKKPPAALSGWHPEDVKAAIRKKGVTLSELSLRHGYSDAYLRNALLRPIYDAEKIISAFIGVPAHEIWPDRYDADGKPNYRRWRELQRARASQRARRAA